MAKYGEIAWEDDTNDNGGLKSTNNKDIWLRLNDGRNVIRLVTLAHQYIVHKGVKKESDKVSFGQKVYCSNPDGKGSCPVCDLGLKASTRWLLGVIDIKTNQYKILDISYQVHSQIKALAKDEVWGDPTKYDINIVVNKKGGSTGYYAVQPIPHKPLGPDAMKARDEANLADLKHKVQPPTVEQTQKRLDKLLEGEAPFIPAPVVKPGQSAPTAGKTTTATKTVAAPQIENGDDENVDDIFPSYDGDSAQA
jgi:hypothetical protein